MKPRSPAITRKWKRGWAVGCSHGHLLDPENRKAVLAFGERWKPETAIHLGDATDLEAFMGKGTAESKVKPSVDMKAGLEFVQEFFDAGGKATDRVFILGNHEDRPWRLTDCTREIVAHAAQDFVNGFNDFAKENKAELVPYDNLSGWVKRGDAKFGHGFMFNENALRDHAEAFGGKIVIAHTHKAGIATGRTMTPSICYGVGTLANVPAMRYAKTLRSRLAWSAGLVFFEYCDADSAIWLVEKTRDSGWRFPL